MPKGAALPSIRQIIELSQGFGIDMPESDAEEYQTLMRGPIASFKRLEELPEYRPPIK